MDKYLKITVVFLLSVQTFHFVTLQDSTDSPGRPIDPSWLRQISEHRIPKAPVAAEELEYDPDSDAAAMDPNVDHSSGIPSGFMTMFEVGDNASSGEIRMNGYPISEDLAVPHKSHHGKDKKHKSSHGKDSPTDMTTNPKNSRQRNMTGDEKESDKSTDTKDTSSMSNHTLTMTNDTSSMNNDTPSMNNDPSSMNNDPSSMNNDTSSMNNDTSTMSDRTSTMNNDTSTAHSISHNSTSVFSNGTDLDSTTLAPEINATQQPPEEEKRLRDTTDSNSPATTAPTTMTRMNEASSPSLSTTAPPSEATETSPVPVTSLAPIAPEKAKKKDKDGASGSSAERGQASDSPRSRRSGAWGVVLGVGVAVSLVGLVVYVILKKKHQMGFSHRKLVEVFPSDPVLRLDNSEPLDLNYGGGAYYNPAVQGDNIQMSNFPGHHRT